MKRALSIILSLALCLSIFFPGIQPLFARAEAVHNGLTYSISKGKVCITGYTRDFIGDVVIPSEIDGYPVTSIGSFAFENIDGRIGIVVIPASVTELGNSAFRYIYSLYFCGSMPRMERSIFSNATVYFHEGAEGWKMGWLLIDYGDAECVQVSHITPRFTSDNNATCTQNGTERATCLTCGVEMVQTDYGSALGHSYSELVPNNDATCTDNSTSTGQCDVCGAVGTVTNPGTALGHSYGSYVSNDNGSCYTDGTMSAVCARCGKTDTKAEEGTGVHQYADGICTVCGMPDGAELPVSGLTYRISENQATITGYNGTVDGLLRIPAALEDCPVTAIDQNAFAGCTDLKAVFLPHGITSIGEAAFRDCGGLKILSFTGGPAQIAGNAFAGVTATVCYPSEGTDWTREDCSNYGGTLSWRSHDAVYTSDKNATCTADGTKTGVCQLCGMSCTVTDAGTAKGHNAGSLTTVKQSNVDEEGLKEQCCTRCKEVLYSEVLPRSGTGYYGPFTYTLSTDGKIKIIDCDPWAEGKLVVPDTINGYPVVSISSTDISGFGDWAGAFENCEYLTEVVLPDGLIGIGESAFLSCDRLTRITVPASVTFVGARAFAYCPKLDTVEFTGSAPTFDTYYDPWDWGESEAECRTFENSNVTAYYPAGDTSWTQSIRNGCGTGVTWVAGCKTHSAGEWTTKTQATATAYGLEVQRCTVCDALLDARHPKHPDSLASGTYQAGQSWQLDRISGVLTISGEGTLTDQKPWYSYRNQILRVTINEGITKIGDRAFQNLPKLKSVSIPDTVISLGVEAFTGCSALEYTTEVLETGNYHDCTAYYLGSASNPYHVLTALRLESFEGDTYPSWAKYYFYIEINRFCKIIGPYVDDFPLYYERIDYFAVAVPDGLRGISDYGFESSVAHFTKIPAGLTYIGSHSLGFRTLGSKITLPPTITEIGECPFNMYDSLTSVCFTGSAPKIGASAFGGKTVKIYYPANDPTWTEAVRQNYGGTLTWVPVCDEHTPGDWVTVKAPTAEEEGVKEQRCSVCGELLDTAAVDKLLSGQCGPELIWTLDPDTGLLTISGNGEMSDTTAHPWEAYADQVKNLVIEEGATSIANGAFSQLLNLTSAQMPQSLNTIGDHAFFECTSLTSVTLPDELEYMGKSAFYKTGLTAVTVPRGITEFGTNVFDSCSALTSVTLPDDMTQLPEGILFGCSALETVTLPQSITTIGDRAFYKCVALKNITIPAAVQSVGSFAFYNNTMQALTFLGDAPDFASDAFRNLTATVRYPGNNATWTGRTQTYGGTVTWEPWYPVIPELTLKYPTLSFEEEVVLNVYFDAQKLDDVVQMGLITYDREVSQWSVDNAGHIISDYSYAEAEGFYVARTQGIPAAQMDQPMYFALYAQLTDGSYTYSSLVSYSPTTYAYNQLENETMGTIVVALLNYGAAAQTYFGTDTDGLMNSSLTAEQLAMAENYRSDMITPVAQLGAAQQGAFTSTGGFDKRYPNVSFEGNFSIGYFAIPSVTPVEGMTMYVWDQATVDSGAVLTVENAVDTVAMTDPGTGTWQATVEDIAACRLDEGVYVAFCYSDGEADYCSGVLAYSIGTYCTSKANSTDPIAPLARVTAVYGYYAKQLFGK